MRLQKFIAASGLCSRREAEERIRQGRVTKNGVTASLGDGAEEGDDVRVDGVSVSPVIGHTYIMLNKPRGVVTTMKDEQGRRTVAELTRDVGARLLPVGRLDLQSEGLLIMTDDGELLNRLAHPSHETEKTYRVRVHGAPLEEAMETLRQPITWEGVTYRADKVELCAENTLEITVHEGKNHEIRNMCAAVGLKVERLQRIRQAGLALGTLPPGKWRYLTEDEIKAIKGTR